MKLMDKYGFGENIQYFPANVKNQGRIENWTRLLHGRAAAVCLYSPRCGALMLCFIDGGRKVCWLSRNTKCHIHVIPFLCVILLGWISNSSSLWPKQGKTIWTVY
jgi:hypothetical protein